MTSVLHHRIVSTKAEWRADASRRSLPPVPHPLRWPAPVPIPLTVGQLKPWHPVRLLRLVDHQLDRV